jgi:hypothetical protein
MVTLTAVISAPLAPRAGSKSNLRNKEKKVQTAEMRLTKQFTCRGRWKDFEA